MVKFIHYCAIGCGQCSGSGETVSGAPGNCSRCHGKGMLREEEIELDIDPDEYLGPIWCPECGADLRKEIAMEKEADQIKTEFRYYRDLKNTVRVIVCNLRQGDKLARGIALCSLRDQPNAKFGRRIALGRAQKALNKGTCSRSIMRSEHAYVILAKCNVERLYFEQPKATFYPAEVLAATGTEF